MNILLKGLINCLLLICVVFIAGCGDKKSGIDEEPNQPMQPTQPDEDKDKDSIPDVPVMPDVTESKSAQYKNMGISVEIKPLKDGIAQLSVLPGEFDLASVKGNSVQGTVHVPGMIPGSPDLALEVALSKTEEAPMIIVNTPYCYSIQVPEDYSGTEWEMHGEGENEYLKYSLHGVLDGNKNKVYLSWETIENKKGIIKNGNWLLNHFSWNNSSTTMQTSPFFIEWETSLNPMSEKGLSATDFLQLILNTPFLPANSYGLAGTNTNLISIGYLSQIIMPVIKFDDNKVYLDYLCHHSDLEENYGIEPFVSFPNTTYTYSVVQNDEMRLYINPGGLFDVNIAYEFGIGGAEFYYPMNTPDLYALISNTLLGLSPDVSLGLPMKVEMRTDRLDWYITDSERCVDLLKKILIPIFADDINRRRFLRAMKEDADLSDYAEAFEKSIMYLQEMLESTKEMKFGLSAIAVDLSNKEILSKYIEGIR